MDVLYVWSGLCLCPYTDRYTLVECKFGIVVHVKIVYLMLASLIACHNSETPTCSCLQYVHCNLLYLWFFAKRGIILFCSNVSTMQLVVCITYWTNCNNPEKKGIIIKPLIVCKKGQISIMELVICIMHWMSCNNPFCLCRSIHWRKLYYILTSR